MSAAVSREVDLCSIKCESWKDEDGNRMKKNLSEGKWRWPETMSRGRRRRKGRTPDSPM